MLLAFFDTAIFTWVVLPLLIFVARILDVSLGTVRVVLVSRGVRALSALVGFFEVLIWIIVIGQIIKNLNNAACYVAYAGGFATGTFVGTWLADKLAVGFVIVRVVTQHDASELIDFFNKSNVGATTVDAEGAYGPVKIIFMVIKRQDLRQVIDNIKRFNPNAFYSIEDVRSISQGIFPMRKGLRWRNNGGVPRPFRKGK